ncbi:MAG TPA: hypothetical protein VHI13_01245 [Candidatus Kapabacteria bacterium]|nr:hypothetical protein [Candidatus Kapabacteria bacterium]
MERNKLTRRLTAAWLAPALIALAACTLHARGQRAATPSIGPNGNMGGWLGSGPLFGFDDPLGPHFGDEDGGPTGSGGFGGYGSGFEWGDGGGTGGGGGGGWNGGGTHSKGCLEEMPESDFGATVFVSVCMCRVKYFRGQSAGSYGDGNCAKGSPVDAGCEVPGDCCQGVVPYSGT